MVIYPDIDELLISYLQSTLLTITGYENVNIAPIKSMNDTASEVIVTAAYNSDVSKVHRNASAVLEVYADTFEKANTLSLIVDALIREATVNGIKKVEVILGPVRTDEKSTLEKRSLSVDLVVKATQMNP